MSTAPPGWPEGWPEPNYDNPPTHGSPALFIATTVITAITVILRFYSRHYLTQSVGLDDYLLLAGFIFSIGQTFAEYKALTTWGWNLHLWDIPLDRLQYVRLAAWLVEFFFVVGNACVKISILLLYRKISSRSHSYWFVRLTWAAIAFTAAYTVGLVLELCLICQPLTAYWKSYSPTYTKKYSCGNELPPIVFAAAASVFSDIYSSVLPMLLTRKLHLSSRQRLGLYILFSAGLVTAPIGIVRLCLLLKVTTNYKLSLHTRDITWYGWPLFALTDIEAHLAMICASAPALKVIVKRRFCRATNLNSSIHSNHPRKASIYTPFSNTELGTTAVSRLQSTTPFQDQQSQTAEDMLEGGPGTDEDVEDLVLHHLDTDEALASHNLPIAELQGTESRKWPG